MVFAVACLAASPPTSSVVFRYGLRLPSLKYFFEQRDFSLDCPVIHADVLVSNPTFHSLREIVQRAVVRSLHHLDPEHVVARVRRPAAEIPPARGLLDRRSVEHWM